MSKRTEISKVPKEIAVRSTLKLYEDALDYYKKLLLENNNDNDIKLYEDNIKVYEGFIETHIEKYAEYFI